MRRADLGGGRRGACWAVRGMMLLGGLCPVSVRSAHEAAIPSAGEVAFGSPVARLVPGGAGAGNPALSAGAEGWRFGAGSTHPLGFAELERMGVWVGRGRSGWRPGWTARWADLEAGDLYREDQLELDVAAGGERWQGGAGWRSGRTAFAGQANDWTQGWTAGALARPLDGICLGGSWEDRAGFHASDPRLAQPWILRLGIAAEAGDSTWASQASMERRQGTAVSWSLGQEIRWKILALRAGLRLDPWVLSFGAGIRWRGIQLDWAQEGDAKLGWQQHWTISVMP